jgi:hypothetical protein
MYLRVPPPPVPRLTGQATKRRGSASPPSISEEERTPSSVVFVQEERGDESETICRGGGAPTPLGEDPSLLTEVDGKTPLSKLYIGMKYIYIENEITFLVAIIVLMFSDGKYY